MVSNIPFGSYKPEWTDYLKTYSSIFGGIPEKWPYHLPSIRNFTNFPSNGKYPRSSSHTSMPLSSFFFQLPAWKTTGSLLFLFWVTVDREYAREESGEAARAEAWAKKNCPLPSLLLFTITLHNSTCSLRVRVALRQFWGKKDDRLWSTGVPIMLWEIFSLTVLNYTSLRSLRIKQL